MKIDSRKMSARVDELIAQSAITVATAVIHSGTGDVNRLGTARDELRGLLRALDNAVRGLVDAQAMEIIQSAPDDVDAVTWVGSVLSKEDLSDD